MFFQVLFKANLIFKDFSRQFSIFKCFSSLCKPCRTSSLNWCIAFFHHIGTMTNTPGIGNFSAKMPKIGKFLVLLAILSNHKKTSYIYLNLAVVLTYNHHWVMYYIRLCNVDQCWIFDNFKPTFTLIKMMIYLRIFFWFEIGNFPPKIGKKNTFWHWEYDPITAIKSAKNKPCDVSVKKFNECLTE